MEEIIFGNKASDQIKKTPMYHGLSMLNDYLEAQNAPEMTFYIVGGFAMIAQGLRDGGVTDIDYVGADLPKDIAKELDRIGLSLDMGAGWVNNDLMLSGSSIKDLEISTGKLHFTKTADIGRVHMKFLDEKDLLRMKVLAVDTSLSAVELGGDFTRLKDLPDIARMMEARNLDMLGLEMETFQYCIADSTYLLIEDYLQHNDLEKAAQKADELTGTEGRFNIENLIPEFEI